MSSLKKEIKLKFLFRRKALKEWYSEFFFGILSSRYNVIIDEVKPDFVFHEAHLIDIIPYSGVRIAFSSENVRPDFNISDYGIGFDHIKFQDRYIRFPLYLFYSGSVKAAELRPESILALDLQSLINRKFCNFLVSNGTASDFRTQFYLMLCQYRGVDSGGNYLNSIGEPVKDKSAWQKEYKFSLCFKNSSTSRYLTEKLIQAYSSNTIPIYWGDPDSFGSLYEGKGGINPEAVIWVDPVNPEIALDRIKELDSNPGLYLEMLKKPLFIDHDHVPFFENSLKDFLFSIFDQDTEAAYRRGFGQVRLRVENRNIARSSILKSFLNYFKKRIKF